MEESVSSSDDIEGFRQQLRGYEDFKLRMIQEYFTQDLTHILQDIHTRALLVEIKSKDVLKNAEEFLKIKEQLGSEHFANTLLQEIWDLGREAVIGLWECLYVLQKDHPHPNLLAALDEIKNRGDYLVEQIVLDEHGLPLTPELTEMQTKHKTYLLEMTKNLVELKPPGSTLKEQEFPIIERYVDLIVVSTDQFRDRSQNELIQTGEKHEECLKETQTALEHISPNRLFRWNRESQRVPHAVMVSGVPGIGKTTLMQKFLYDWVTGKLYQRFAFVFFFRFRNLNKHPEVSLEEMILHQYPYLQSQLRNILQDPEKLLFIFDGLDESIHHMDFTSHKPCSDPKMRKDSGVIVDSLVRKHLLSGCSVLMTSRPTKLASIDTCVFQRIAEIMGFLPRDRQIYFEHFFENKELSEKAFYSLQENDTLYTFCYIPSFCWIICTVISMCLRAQPENQSQLLTSLPKTITQLFVTFVSNILANHSLGNEGHTVQTLLTSMGWMAEYGVMNHVIVFDKRYLGSFSVRNDGHLFSCFLMESGQHPDVDYTFLHLTLQEFFGALVHYMDYNADRLQESLEKAESQKDGRAEILIRFLCGLSDLSTRSMLRSHVGELSVPASRDVITWLQKKLKNQQSRKDKRELLNVFFCLHETRNKALVLECLQSQKLIDFSRYPLSPLDFSVLSFILESRRETEEVNLRECNIQDEGLKKLAPALHTIKSLSLGANDLTDTACPHLASGIRNNRTLNKLYLSANNLEGPPLKILMEALTTSSIEELNLERNRLTNISNPYLAPGIRNNPTLKKLNLSGNNLEGPELGDLMEALTTSNIEELDLRNNRLTDSSCSHLASGIRNNPTLRRLVLTDNNLEGPHLGDLMEALPTSRIEELLLIKNHLTDKSCPHLASGIRNNLNLRKLIMTENNLEGPHFRELMAALSTSCIEELDLRNNNLTDYSNPHLASGIRNNHNLKKLDLSENYLEGPHLSDLMEALTTSSIEELVLWSNHLTDRSRPHLASGISNNPNLRKLDVSYNSLESTYLGDLMEALKKSSLEELKIVGNIFSEQSRQQLTNLKPGLKVHV